MVNLMVGIICMNDLARMCGLSDINMYCVELHVLRLGDILCSVACVGNIGGEPNT